MNKTSNEDFIRAWQGSNSVAEVREKLPGFPNPHSRAAMLRKIGVPLKRYALKKVNTNALIELAKSLGGIDGQCFSEKPK